MPSTIRLVSVFAACMMLCGLVASVGAGPLNPPAGPVAPTPGPEPRIAVNSTNTPGDANSVYRIAAPGSYYLTGNVMGEAGKHGIEFASGGIVLDLNGFSVIGNGPGSGTFDGISPSFSGPSSGLTIRNGRVSSWGRNGIGLNVSFPTGCVVEDVHASLNTGSGIAVPADSVVSRCTATGNSGFGFSAGAGSAFESCVASQNVLGGFLGTDGSSFRGCEARANSGDGFQVNHGCTFDSCTAVANTGQFGFDAGVACVFRGCSAIENTGSQSTSAGFECQGGCLFEACSSFLNATTNANPTPTTGAGFILGVGSTISGCVSATNRGDNIRAGNRCFVIGNKSNEAGFLGAAAAIRATGNECRIEGNHCSFSDVGIAVDGNGCTIVRNTSAQNTTDYAIAANNFYGPIISRVGTTSAAVSGSSASGTLGTTDPNANFSR